MILFIFGCQKRITPEGTRDSSNWLEGQAYNLGKIYWVIGLPRETEDIDGLEDVPKMLLDVSKMKSLEWRPRYNSEKSILGTIKSFAKLN